MKANIVAAAIIARIVAAAPAPQQFDFDAVLAAPSPSVTGPPVGAISEATTAQDTAVIAASISFEVTAATSASITSAPTTAAASSTPPPSAFEKRGWYWWYWWPTTSQRTTSIPKPSSTVWTSSSSSSKPSSSSSVSTTTTYAPGATLEPCSIQPGGDGPQVQPDTVDAFLSYAQFQKEAQTAPSSISSYDIVFRNLNASVNANSYLTYFLLDGYDVTGCASHCDNTALCTAFNVFVERDPSINPNTNATDASLNCPNPASETNYKCSLWGSSIDASAATNNGQWRDNFQVVIAASNAYDKTNKTAPPTCPGYQPPKSCNGGAINAGGNYWLGSNFYPGAFDPRKCQYFAQAQSAKNKDVARKGGKSSYSPVNMFNAYCVTKNSVAQGTYCSLYASQLAPSSAGFRGAWSGRNYFGVQSSYTYTLSQYDNGRL